MPFICSPENQYRKAKIEMNSMEKFPKESASGGCSLFLILQLGIQSSFLFALSAEQEAKMMIMQSAIIKVILLIDDFLKKAGFFMRRKKYP